MSKGKKIDEQLSFEEIKESILEQIQVDTELHEEIGVILSILKEKILLDLSSLGVAGSVEIQGSFIRRTYLSEDESFDLMLMLSSTDKGKVHRILDSLESRLKKDRIRKNPIQVTKITGKIPYLRILAEGELIHLFVGFDISHGEDSISIFDLIPLHTTYILNHMSENQKKEVLLLKKFAKTIGVYRNEIGAVGFNGYLCELLILFYGSFQDAINSISKWRPRTIIDLKKNRETLEDVDEETVEMLQRYYPLYVPDPLRPGENVAADVSMDQFNSIISATNLFLHYPSLKFFIHHPCDLPSFQTLTKKIADSGKVILVLSTDRRFQESEVCWQKALSLKKAFEFELKRNNYKVDRIRPFSSDERYGILISLFNDLPDMAIRKEGPLITSKESLIFLEKYNTHIDVIEGPFIEDHKWVIYFANRGQEVYDFIHSIVKQNTFILSVDSFLKMEVKTKHEIHTIGEELQKLYEEDLDFAEMFYFFVERKPSWICGVDSSD